MFIVVDVNVIISSLLSKGDSLKVFILNSIFDKYNFVIPEFFLVELNKHTERIQARSKLSGDEVIKVADFIMRQNCPIFSGDKSLKQIYPENTLSPKEMLNKFYMAG